jgi:hypothetical protein
MLLSRLFHLFFLLSFTVFAGEHQGLRDCRLIVLTHPDSLDAFYKTLRGGTATIESAKFPDGREVTVSPLRVGFTSRAFCLGEPCDHVLVLPKDEESEIRFNLETKLRKQLESAGIEIAPVIQEGTENTSLFQVIDYPKGISLTNLVSTGELSSEQQEELIFIYRTTKAIGVAFDTPEESLIWVSKKGRFVYSYGSLEFEPMNVSLRLDLGWPRAFDHLLPANYQDRDVSDSAKLAAIKDTIARLVEHPEEQRKAKALLALQALPPIIQAKPTYNLRMATVDNLKAILGSRKLPRFVTTSKPNPDYYTVPEVYSEVGGHSLRTTKNTPAVICDAGAVFCTSLITFVGDGTAVQLHHPLIDEQRRDNDQLLADYRRAIFENLSNKGPVTHLVTGMNLGVDPTGRRDRHLEKLPIYLPEGNILLAVSKWGRGDTIYSAFLPENDPVMGFIFVPKYLSKTGKNEVLILNRTCFDSLEGSPFSIIFHK